VRLGSWLLISSTNDWNECKRKK